MTESIFEKQRALTSKQAELLSKKRVIDIKRITKEQKELEKTMMSLKNPKLLANLEVKREKLEEDSKRLHADNDSQENKNQNKRKLLSMCQKLFDNPVRLRVEGSPMMRKLLVEVRS